VSAAPPEVHGSCVPRFELLRAALSEILATQRGSGEAWNVRVEFFTRRRMTELHTALSRTNRFSGPATPAAERWRSPAERISLGRRCAAGAEGLFPSVVRPRAPRGGLRGRHPS
jgi:hypothetical protein